MAINKINNDILSQRVTQDSVNRATSGKKDILQNSATEKQKMSLDDIPVFSQDAKRLQETEVILQNALGKLREMDEITESNLLGIKDKIKGNFYENDTVAGKIVDDLFPEQEMRNRVEKRMKAESYLSDLKKMDDIETIDEKKINQIRDRIDNGFYSSRKVFDAVAEDLLSVLEV
jgi:hypothetical protein